MSFLTNPKQISESVDYFNPKRTSIGAFRELLEKLSDNYRALGSRIAIINFGNNFQTVKGSRLD
jgi:hypothetical protein